MRVLPVLDIKNGHVVRGIAGRRAEYQPIDSRLTKSTQPIAMALAFRDSLGVCELYLADLDAIAGSPPSLALFAEMSRLGFQLWVDAGLRKVETARELIEAGVQNVIAGLETLPGPADLSQLVRRHGHRMAFSLDMKNGRPLGDVTKWQNGVAQSLAEEAISCGVENLILLDIARVGLGDGTGTEELAATVLSRHPQLKLVTGGGISNRQDLERMKRVGVSAVLVASALHDGRITRTDIESLADS